MYQEENKDNYFELNKFIFCFNKNIISIIKDSYNDKKYNTYYSLSEKDNKLSENKKYDEEITFLGFKFDKYREFIFPEKNINLILNEKNTIIPECFFIDKRIHEAQTDHNDNKFYFSSICNFIILKDDIINVDFKFDISKDLEKIQLLSVLDQSLNFANYEKVNSEIIIDNTNKLYRTNKYDVKEVFGKNIYKNKYCTKF